MSTISDIPQLAAFESEMSDSEKDLAKLLLDLDQQELLSGWSDSGDADQKHQFFEQVQKLNEAYPGGISAYVSRAKDLLAASAAGENPFEGLKPEVPSGVSLNLGESEFESFNDTGFKAMKDCAFVLVAGGLGERLGYSGIKIALPTQITTEQCYLDMYIQQILRFQSETNALNGTDVKLPLAIMTSDDTHARTVDLLEENDYFGMDKDQVTLMKQDKVASLVDNDAHFALESTYSIATKPHGHGDVHVLLHNTGVAAKWAEEGRRYVVFFQDTNSLCFLVTPAALGVSEERKMAVNSITIPRKAGEAVGAITRLVRDDGSSMTCNVEYNQLDPLLRATTGDGDVNDDTGYSPYPGNINQLIMELGSYNKTLKETGGLVAEFVNPKYADASKTKFKSPTRLECMMQDLPKLLDPSENVGFTNFEAWTYSPVKNSIAEAQAKAKSGVPMRCASEGEMEVYDAGCRLLRLIGCDVAEAREFSITGFTLPEPPHVVLHPRFGFTPNTLRSRFTDPSQVHIRQGSTLVLEGDITIDSLDLEGALIVRAAPGARVHIKSLSVRNAGFKLVPLAEGESAPDSLKIRGYKLEKTGAEEIVSEEGEKVVE